VINYACVVVLVAFFNVSAIDVGMVFRSFRHQRCVGMGFFGSCGFDGTTEFNLA